MVYPVLCRGLSARLVIHLVYFPSFAILRGWCFEFFNIRWVQRPSIAACSLACVRHAGYRPVRGLRKLYTNGPSVASLLLKRQVDFFIARDGGWAKESWHCVAVSFSWMKKEGGSSSSVPGFMYSVYHVTLIHPIEPSIYRTLHGGHCLGIDLMFLVLWLVDHHVLLFSRIQEGIADYIPSLDQGLAVLTNSTLPLRNASYSLAIAL